LAAITGEVEAGLSTIVFPATTGATTRPTIIAQGKFQGGMATPAPSGI
jgi:hypothetical protein